MVDTTRYNTGNELGSNKLEDLSDNAKNIDNFSNSGNETFHDRFGVVRKSIAGMESDHVDQINAHEIEHDAQISAHEVEHDAQMQAFESDFDGRLAGMAFTRVGSFATGATLTDMRQVLVWEASKGGDGHEYGWTGSFPKVVTAGATPATSGGIGAGAWVDRTDVTLRGELIANGNSIYDISLVPTKIGKVIYATDYATPTLAYDATPSGGVLFFPAGVYPPLPTITKPITIIGAGVPGFNSGFTGLEGGTIIKGPLTHYSDNVRLINFGVDSGYDVCGSLYAGKAQEGIVCLASHAASKKYGFIGHNLSVICKDSTSAVHAWALERHQYADVNNIKTCYGLHGQEYKVIDSNISNLISISAGGNGVIIRRDENAECRSSNFNNITINCFGSGGSGSKTTQQGLTLESIHGDFGGTSGYITNINISNISISGASINGIYINGAITASDAVADVNISNAMVYDCENGKSEYGRVLRVTYSDCTFTACTKFGATDGVSSEYSKHVNCSAINCRSGFVGFGHNFITNGCNTDGNTEYGYYAKVNSSCYRANCRGSESTLFGNDSGTYWFELGLITNTGIQVSPPLQHSWVEYGSPFEKPQYWLANDGTVRLHGAVKSGTLGVAVFTLPEGFRPSTKRRFVVSAANASTDVFDTISINNDGNVIVEVTGSNNLVSFDGISFIPSR